jgi:hypothetical protein
LQPEELVRVLRPGSNYHNALLVYWAAQNWHASATVAAFVQQEMAYSVGKKQRKLVFLQG